MEDIELMRYDAPNVILMDEFITHPDEELDVEIRELIYHKLGDSKDYNNDLFMLTAPYEVIVRNDGEQFNIKAAQIMLNEPKYTKLRTFLLPYETARLVLTDERYKKGFQDFIYKMRLPAYKVDHHVVELASVVRITFYERY